MVRNNKGGRAARSNKQRKGGRGGNRGGGRGGGRGGRGSDRHGRNEDSHRPGRESGRNDRDDRRGKRGRGGGRVDTIIVQKKGGKKEGLPRLQIQKHILEKLRYAASQFREASKLAAAAENMEDEIDDNGSHNSYEQDSEGDDDYDGAEGHEDEDEDFDEDDDDDDDFPEDWDEEESDDFSDDYSEEEDYDDDPILEPSPSNRLHVRIDDDYEDETPVRVTGSSLSAAASQGIDTSHLMWLEGMGFSSDVALTALKLARSRDRLDALASLYSAVLGKDVVRFGEGRSDPLTVYGVDGDAMLAQRLEESMVLESIFEDRFSQSEDFWTVKNVSLAIPSSVSRQILVREKPIFNLEDALLAKNRSVCRFYLQGKCKYGSACKSVHDVASSSSRSSPDSNLLSGCKLEVYFPHHSRYPYEPPLLIFRDPAGRLSLNLQACVTLWLQDQAALLSGQQMIYSLVDALSGDVISTVLDEPPDRFLAATDFVLETPESVVIGGPSQSGRSSARDDYGGPVPTQRQVKYGVRVAIVLKQDQPTGRTVEGEVADILTRGDHPRGIKVRLKDGRVGRVQWLVTAPTPQKPPETSMKKVDTVEEVTKKAQRMSLGSKSTPKKSETKPMITSINNRPLVALSDQEELIPEEAPPPVPQKVKPTIPDEVLDKQSKEIFDSFQRQQQTTGYIKMQQQRHNLPAWTLRTSILQTVRNNRVIVISGETGCGKTTQVPQYIYDEAIQSRRGARCKILVTQPRRISAIGVAERVASERGERLGGTVGYQIRLENCMSDFTRILFCTTGILLRRLEEGGADGGIDDVSHIVVDEVHERSLDSDFLLMVLRDLLEVRTDLTLILMSATLNAELFQQYFGSNTPRVHIPGRTFPVKTLWLEDALQKTGYQPDGDLARKGGPRAITTAGGSTPGRGGNHQGRGRGQPQEAPQPITRETPDEELDAAALQRRYPHISSSAIKSLSQVDMEKIQYPLIEQLVVWMAQELLG
ncbi:ATPdependent RNA helicase, partial [Rhizophlyctis rosea]